MLARGVAYSGTAHLFDRVISVAEAGAFKPHAATYRTACSLVGVEPATGPQKDTTPPASFALIRPRNRLATRKRGLRFAWQRSRDAGGIKLYRLYGNGDRVRTVYDKDGPGGRDPKPRTRFRLRGGKHRWYVRAYDYAGNARTSRAFKRSKGPRKSSVLFVQKRKSR